MEGKSATVFFWDMEDVCVTDVDLRSYPNPSKCLVVRSGDKSYLIPLIENRTMEGSGPPLQLRNRAFMAWRPEPDWLTERVHRDVLASGEVPIQVTLEPPSSTPPPSTVPPSLDSPL